MFHFSFRVALSMNSLMFESSISDFLIFLSLKVLHLATYPTLNHTHPEHSRTSPNLLSSEAWPAGLCCGWRVCGRDWGQKPTGIASCSPACINGCKKSQEQIIPRTAGGFFYLTKSLWLTLKENKGAKIHMSMHTRQLGRRPGIGNETIVNVSHRKYMGKANQIDFWSFFLNWRQSFFAEISGL